MLSLRGCLIVALPLISSSSYRTYHGFETPQERLLSVGRESNTRDECIECCMAMIGGRFSRCLACNQQQQLQRHDTLAPLHLKISSSFRVSGPHKYSPRVPLELRFLLLAPLGALPNASPTPPQHRPNLPLPHKVVSRVSASVSQSEQWLAPAFSYLQDRIQTRCAFDYLFMVCPMDSKMAIAIAVRT